MAEVAFQHVAKVYPDGTRAVDDLTLEIDDGEFVVIVGPSGSGKTTALRMVAGLEEISEGTISIGGRVVNDFAPRDRDIAMVFQTYALYPHLSVFENMAFGLKVKRLADAVIRRRVEQAAELLELSDLLDHKPRALSGGQRVAMGRAIVREAVRLPDGRAAVESRCAAPHPHARRDRPNPAAARDHDDLRHARPGRGDDDERPGRRHAARRIAAVCAAAGDLRTARERIRRWLHRITIDELPRRDDPAFERHDQRRAGRSPARARRIARAAAPVARDVSRREGLCRHPSGEPPRRGARSGNACERRVAWNGRAARGARAGAVHPFSAPGLQAANTTSIADLPHDTAGCSSAASIRAPTFARAAPSMRSSTRRRCTSSTQQPVRGSTVDGERVRELLAAERRELERTLAHLRHEDDGDEAGFQEPANLAAKLYLDELEEGLAENLRDRLAALERAEARLAAGTYGLSIESGKPIPDERLEAFPTAERRVEEEAT
jgi:ABC-type uncharacterized transport system YnjBCD ATPase subunit/RNA polymerase-binding transcription factor DksA